MTEVPFLVPGLLTGVCRGMLEELDLKPSRGGRPAQPLGLVGSAGRAGQRLGRPGGREVTLPAPLDHPPVLCTAEHWPHLSPVFTTFTSPASGTGGITTGAC